MVSALHTAYTLTSGCVLMLFIPLGMLLGQREVFMFGTTLYIAGSIGCACSQSSMAFIACRVIEGIGACACVPSGFAVLAASLPMIPGRTFRQSALGVFAAGAPLGSAIGTVLGGLPTQYSAIKWRGIFAVLAGLGGLTTLCTFPFMPKTQKIKVPGGPDWLGTLFIDAALCLFLFGLTQGSEYGWIQPSVLPPLIIGILLFPVFVFYEIWLERTGKTPVLRMSTFVRSRGAFGLINLLGFFGFASFAINDFWIALFYQQIEGLDAIGVMLRYLPQAIGGIVSAYMANYLLTRISTQYVFLLGSFCGIMSNMILALVRPGDSYWARGQFMAFYLGITCACCVYASSILYSVSVVPSSEIGAAGGVFQVMTSLAPAVMNTIAFIVFNNSLKANPASPALAFNHANMLGIGLAGVAFLGAIPALWGIGIIGKTGQSAAIMAEGNSELATVSVPVLTEDKADEKA